VQDTTAGTLGWTLFELAKRPDCVQRLRDEILDTVGPHAAPTYADLKGMKYLQHVMDETLRLYPAVPFNIRVSLKDTFLPVGGGESKLEVWYVYRAGYQMLTTTAGGGSSGNSMCVLNDGDAAAGRHFWAGRERVQAEAVG